MYLHKILNTSIYIMLYIPKYTLHAYVYRVFLYRQYRSFLKHFVVSNLAKLMFTVRYTYDSFK